MIWAKYKSDHVKEDEQANFFIQKKFFDFFFQKSIHISLNTFKL